MQLQFQNFSELFSYAATVFFFAEINSAYIFCGRVHGKQIHILIFTLKATRGERLLDRKPSVQVRRFKGGVRPLVFFKKNHFLTSIEARFLFTFLWHTSIL